MKGGQNLTSLMISISQKADIITSWMCNDREIASVSSSIMGLKCGTKSSEKVGTNSKYKQYIYCDKCIQLIWLG